jgi:hypothetical protein
VTGAVSGGRQDSSARFYAAETAKVLQGFLHAAALTGRTLAHVLEWVANPVAAEQPAEILQQHPHAAKFWDGLLSGALHGSADTVGNTVTTVQQAMSLFFQPEIRARCVPSRGRPATDIADLIASQGTVYLLGREDPYAAAAPLMTAIAEHVLDTALEAANTGPHGRMTPCFLACLDELPSTTPCRRCGCGWPTNARWACRSFTPARPEADGPVLRRGRGPVAVRAHQQPGDLWWRQGHSLLQGDLRSHRRCADQPPNRERWSGRHRHLPIG